MRRLAIHPVKWALRRDTSLSRFGWRASASLARSSQGSLEAAAPRRKPAENAHGVRLATKAANLSSYAARLVDLRQKKYGSSGGGGAGARVDKPRWQDVASSFGKRVAARTKPQPISK
jgi:hypothetical protein